jgi:hypothetical protein
MEQQNQGCGVPPTQLAQSPQFTGVSEASIIAPKKKSAVDELMGEALKSNNGSKKATGFLDSIQK